MMPDISVTQLAREECEIKRFPAPTADEHNALPFPNGWFAACFSRDIRAGTVRAIRFMGRELVAYRTPTGEVCVIDAHCPHLGAHFGYGGKMEGENIVCPFHGLTFAPSGICVRTCNGNKPPAAVLHKWASQERNGMVMVWHDRGGRDPLWEIAEVDVTGFSPIRSSQREMKGFPHDLAENSADATHFTWLHGFEEVETKHTIGDYWINFKMTGRWRGVFIDLNMTAYGLGHVFGDIEVPKFGARVRTRAFSTPTEVGAWTFRWADDIKLSAFDALPGFMRKILYSMILLPAHYWFLLISSKDFPVWAHRTYVEAPRYMTGDASVAAFRRWMQRFYA